MYEEVQRGTLSELLNLFENEEPRGEYTIVIAGAA
jgi:16S rRNA C1402 (ribose-2'-O) methylase RsmI